MGICKDQSTTYLKRLGYNVVRHPQQGIVPLDLIGRQKGTTGYLGSIEKLITSPAGPRPSVERDLAAADVNGQKSSKFSLSVGADILGSIIGAMGGQLGIQTSYTNARKVEFHFTGVLKDRATPLDVGDYLRDGEVDAGNTVLREYVIGNGDLFLVLETIKTKQLVVRYERDQGVDAAVDVEAIQDLVGGQVAVTASAASGGMVSYEGSEYLTFGFRSYEVGIDDGELRLMASKPGSVPLAAGLEGAEAQMAADAAVLTPEGVGLLDIDMSASLSS
jgi:hypothetical protein